jgi:hypothetical protein
VMPTATPLAEYIASLPVKARPAIPPVGMAAASSAAPPPPWAAPGVPRAAEAAGRHVLQETTRSGRGSQRISRTFGKEFKLVLGINWGLFYW